MTEEAVGRIFKPFEQADATIANRFGGTGLGMSITQNLVTLMSGRIDIQSRPGGGTVCTVDLPLLRDEQNVTQPDFANLRLRAIVVDDEQAACEETTALLEKIMIQAEWALSGAEAVERVTLAQRQNMGFDFCLIDWKMPDMDGIEVMRRIRANVGPGLSIVMISAYDSTEIEEEAKQAGVNAFLPKPLYRSSVYSTIQSALLNGREGGEGPTVQTADFLQGKRLLVAEDNELNREIVTELLNMSGASVECVENGKEAMQTFLDTESGHFDAILMDVQMPVMNGHEAARHIRAASHPDAQRIPIIATTANAFSDDISAALAAGMNAHVSKPLDMAQLCRVLMEQIQG